MKRIVLLLPIFFALPPGTAMAQVPDRPVVIDQSTCTILDDSATKAERYLVLVLPEGRSNATALAVASKVNVNVQIPHRNVAASDVMLAMHEAMKNAPQKIDLADRVKLALALGCTDAGVEYVSYRMKVEGPLIKLPISSGTSFPLEVSVCVRTKEGPFCFYGTATESTARVELAPRE